MRWKYTVKNFGVKLGKQFTPGPVTPRGKRGDKSAELSTFDAKGLNSYCGMRSALVDLTP